MLEGDVMSAEGDIYKRSLEIAAQYSQMWLDNIASRGINATKSVDEMLEIFGGTLPMGSTNPADVIERMARLGEPGLMNMGSGRFFGWVIGGTLPAPLGADWLVSTWDQNAGMRNVTPTVVALEEIAGTWIKDLLGLPATADVGFPTGATMANFTGLISARHKVMVDAGWDVNQRGRGPKVAPVSDWRRRSGRRWPWRAKEDRRYSEAPDAPFAFGLRRGKRQWACGCRPYRLTRSKANLLPRP